MKKVYPNCLYSEVGCRGPIECLHCGFDRQEAERRKTIPLTRAKDGTRRKRIRSRRKQEVPREAE